MMIPITGMTWRTGRKLGRTIYAQLYFTASDEDTLIGIMDSPEIAQHIVDVHNAMLKAQSVVTKMMEEMRSEGSLPQL